MNNKQMSKFLSLVLRHKPHTIGLTLDKNGWAEVQILLDLINKKAAHKLTFKQLVEIVETNDKQRFAFNEDKSLIRANQGHSINVDVELKASLPPDILYHGTATKYEEAIDALGLRAKTRLHVHLSADIETALKVGARHGKVIVYKVDAKSMREEKHIFYLSENNVWLTDKVPADFLEKIC